MRDCPNNRANIGFIAQVPYHFYVFKNIIKYLKNTEFIVGEPYSYNEPIEIQFERLKELIGLIEKEKIPWRFFDFEKDRNPGKKFFEKYKILIATTANGVITSSLTKSIKKIRIQYGQSKDIFEFGEWNRNFDLILAQGPYSANYFKIYAECKEVGFPKFDDWFNNNLDERFINALKSKLDANKKILLYLPTHGALSSLEKYRKTFSALMNKYNVLVKFHPRTVWYKPEQFLSYKNKGFIVFGDDTDILPLLKVADIVVSDSGGAAFDALLAEKPLVILDIPIAAEMTGEIQTNENSVEQVIKRENKRIGPVINLPDKLGTALEIAKQEFFEERRKQWRKKMFSYVDGQDGKRAADEILSLKNTKCRYSIVIPTYNRVKTLMLTLDSAVKQNIPSDQYEILVIDDGSTDDTRETVLNFQKKYPGHNIKYFHQQNSGPAKARNLGIKESKGEIIFFTDDDCVVPKNWMETLLDGFRRYPEVSGVGGWYRPANKFLAGKYFQKYLEFSDLKRSPEMVDTEISTNLFGYNLAGNTANVAYKKSALEEIGGFDENLYFAGAVDWELKKNIQGCGCHLLYVPLMVEHLKDFDTKTFIKKFFNQGRGRYYMVLKYPDLVQSWNYRVSLKSVFLMLFDGGEFFLASFLSRLSMYCGQVYSRYFKTFKNIKKYNAKTIYNFEITKKKIGGNGILHTKIKPFVIEKQSDSVESSSFYSIIIPTYNRSKTLALTLDSVIHQTIFPDQYEIIVVDDGSTDDTELNVKCFTRQNFEKKFKRARMSNVKCPEIRYFKIEHGGPAKARNKGIKESKGDIIFFTDDDCVVPPDWMETLLDGYKRYPNVVGVGGWLKIPKKIEEKNIFCKFINYVYFCTNSLSASTLFSCEILSNDPIYSFENFACNTANLSIKKNVLNEMNGFCEHYRWAGSEDSDLAFRILNSNRQLLYLPVFVDHIKTLELIGFLKMSFKRGANFYLFKKFNEKSLKELRLNWLDEPDWSRIIRRLLYWPHKSLTFLNFLVYKAGMAYMKHKIEK